MSDSLSQKLGNLVSSLDTHLSLDDFLGTADSFAGGVHLMQILDMPQAATPPEFQLPPPDEAELAALEMIFRSQYAIDNPSSASGPTSSDTTNDSTDDSFSAFASMPDPTPALACTDCVAGSGPKIDVRQLLGDLAESHSTVAPPDYDAPVLPEDLYATSSYGDFTNTPVVGRNQVPTGCYVLREGSVLQLVNYSSAKGWVTSSRALTVSNADPLSRSVYAFPGLNGVSVDDSTNDSTPFFYCVVCSDTLGATKVARVLISDIELVRVTSEYALAKYFADAEQASLHYIYRLVTDTAPSMEPVPLKATLVPSPLLDTRQLPTVSTLPLGVPHLDSVSAILPVLLRLFAGGAVNEEDKHDLLDHLSAIEKLDAVRQRHLTAVASLAAKYS